MKSRTRLFALAALALVMISWAAWQLQEAKDEPPAASGGAKLPSDGGASASDDRTALERELLARGIRFLIASQSADGGWHSDHYGALRGGAATTALVLYAISHAPVELQSQHEQQLRQGWEFLSSGVSQAGYVANPDGSVDYPTYATAMAVIAAHRMGWQLPPELQRLMIDYLLASQLTERQGWAELDAHYGGWDMAGGATASGQRITPGTNLSVTCFAIEALSLDKTTASNEACQKALHYLARCQNLPGDGGFVFSPVSDDPGNKAGIEPVENKPRSYGTMTCDGLRALMLCGESQESVRVRAAAEWLAAHDELRTVPGFSPDGSASPWATDLRFYYFASRAKTSSIFPDQKSSLRNRLTPVLAELQAEDGSWANTTATVRMREDDPLIATALAIIAIGTLVEPAPTLDRP